MRLFFRPKTTNEDGTFVAVQDGDVLLVRARARRTDVSTLLDLTLPCFPLTRSGWRPVYERPVFYIRRMGAEAAEIIGVPFGPGDREPVYLIDCPEVFLNEVWRLAEYAATRTEARP